ncbi:MAG: ABC transporter substrate-binding protein [Sulfurospirillaceae bacterium]|nr:ABC transporter substrate-binding protein [Sulfurospirillaceae bacterium]
MVKAPFLKITFIISFIILALVVAFFVIASKNHSHQTIKLGASLPLSSINQDLGQEVAIGANTYFQHINDTKGGIANKKIDFIYYDDRYEPENTIANTKMLLKEDVFAFFGFVGTPTVKRILPLIAKTNIPFIAPYTGASFLRNDNLPNIVNFRASYKQEIENIVDYLVKQKGVKNIAIFYQNDDYGEEGYIALDEAMKKRNMHIYAEGTYKRNTLSIKQALYELELARPDAIILVGAYKPTAHFIDKARKNILKDVLFCPISFVNADALMSELKGDGKNIIFSQTVPSYSDTSLDEVKEYLWLLQKYYPEHKPTLASFESFLATKTVVLALEKTKHSLTRENFLNSLKTLNKETLASVNIQYKNSQLLNTTYLSIYENGTFSIIKKEVK